MKIGIDARFYGPKQKGLGRYIQKLVENLEQIDSKNQYIIFLRKSNWNEFQPKNNNFKKVLADYKWYGFKEQVFFPLEVYRQKLDLMYFSHFNVPLFYFKPFVFTIHDLILKRFPTRRASTLGPVLYWLKNFAYHLVISSAVKRAKKIIAVSDYTKKDILKYFRVKPEKIKVVYEGAPCGNSKFQVTNYKQIPKSKFQNPKKYSISKKYLLYVGNAYPHKNLKRLISVFKALNRRNNLQLVLVGELDYFYKCLQKKAGNNKDIIFTDFVSDKELCLLYQSAFLYVFSSLCEGFGLPPLEAMSFGVPVACSDNSCLPEILGKSAIYFNPYSRQDMADKIQLILSNQKLRQKLISNGFQAIQKYSWLSMAKEILNVFYSTSY